MGIEQRLERIARKEGFEFVYKAARTEVQKYVIQNDKNHCQYAAILFLEYYSIIGGETNY